jgi:hypothetical protein
MAYGTVNADVIGTSVAGSNLGAGNASIMKNRIINGAMVIDQRNAGASVTPSTGTYTLDRWRIFSGQASKMTAQQNAGSVTPPVGFTNYLGITSSSAYSSGASDLFVLQQMIEGFNTADLQWGTANAKTVTLSFQFYSSLTGTFSGSLMNSAADRSYPFTFTVSSANTWTSISVTVAGDTSGTWVGATNGIGIRLNLNLGSGTSNLSTAGSWAAGQYYGSTGSVSLVGTSGATFYITGVQLEVGSSATGFEYVNYQTSLANCQRYYWKNTGALYSMHGSGTVFSGTQADIYTKLPVSMRVAPTVSLTTTQIQVGATAYAATAISGASGVTTDVAFSRVTTGGTMTTGYGAILTNANNTAGYLDASAEL